MRSCQSISIAATSHERSTTNSDPVVPSPPPHPALCLRQTTNHHPPSPKSSPPPNIKYQTHNNVRTRQLPRRTSRRRRAWRSRWCKGWWRGGRCSAREEEGEHPRLDQIYGQRDHCQVQWWTGRYALPHVKWCAKLTCSNSNRHPQRLRPTNEPGAGQRQGDDERYLPITLCLSDPDHVLLTHLPDDEGNTSTRSLGLLVARGTLLVLISPVDGSEEIENPFLQGEDDE